MDKDTFKKNMRKMGYFYGSPRTEVFDMLWSRLKGFDDEMFSHACKKICDEFVPTTKVPFPIIPHFLKYLNRKQEYGADGTIRN